MKYYLNHYIIQSAFIFSYNFKFHTNTVHPDVALFMLYILAKTLHYICLQLRSPIIRELSHVFARLSPIQPPAWDKTTPSRADPPVSHDWAAPGSKIPGELESTISRGLLNSPTSTCPPDLRTTPIGTHLKTELFLITREKLHHFCRFHLRQSF